jgi:RimJ/RimL family protein N-acetyltransferase
MTVPDDLASLDAASAAGRRPPRGWPVETPPGVRPGRSGLKGLWAAVEPLDPRLHGAGLFAAGHAAADGGAAVYAMLSYGPWPDAAAMTPWLRACAGSADPLFFALRDRASGDPMGMAAFMEVRPADGVAEIGNIWFGPAFRRSRAATGALALMMRHVLDDCGGRRLEWKTNALNIASRRAALRLGFRHEGTFLNHSVVNGMSRDTAWYSILDSEWPAVRAALDRWLDPANFDGTGRQRESLGALTRALW